jgi:hypothetical protein
MKPLDKAVGLGMAHFGALVRDVAQGQIEFVGMRFGATKLAPVVGQDG